MGNNATDLEFIIRRGKLRDIPALLIGAKKFIEYYPIELGYNVPHITKLMIKLINEETLIMAYEKGKYVPAGAIGGVLEGNTYNPNSVVGTELFWWVHPEYRAHGLGDQLLTCFEQEMKLRGAKYIAMTATVKTPNLPERLQARGYTPAESILVKEFK